MWIVAADGLINLDKVKEIRKNGDHVHFYYEDNTYTGIVLNSEPEALQALRTIVSVVNPSIEIEGEEEEVEE